ncbi:MAG: hypothetical protein Q7P63_08260 [Verrucomicrobiota bacterium JB022]|nr:hypothetical protein [Verrucomicrobiota bacterium JB022]
MGWRTLSLGSGWLVAAGLLAWMSLRPTDEPARSPAPAMRELAAPDQTAKLIELHESVFALTNDLRRAQSRIGELEAALSARPTETALVEQPPVFHAPGGRDPNEANLVAQLGFADREALNRTLKHWVIQDPPAATAWLNENASSPVFDDSIHLVAQYLVAQQRYEMAYEWAASIHDLARRQQAVTEVYADAYRSGSMDEQTLENSGLPEAVVASIERGDFFD